MSISESQRRNAYYTESILVSLDKRFPWTRRYYVDQYTHFDKMEPHRLLSISPAGPPGGDFPDYTIKTLHRIGYLSHTINVSKKCHIVVSQATWISGIMPLKWSSTADQDWISLRVPKFAFFWWMMAYCLKGSDDDHLSRIQIRETTIMHRHRFVMHQCTSN